VEKEEEPVAKRPPAFHLFTKTTFKKCPAGRCTRTDWAEPERKQGGKGKKRTTDKDGDAYRVE